MDEGAYEAVAGKMEEVPQMTAAVAAAVAASAAAAALEGEGASYLCQMT